MRLLAGHWRGGDLGWGPAHEGIEGEEAGGEEDGGAGEDGGFRGAEDAAESAGLELAELGPAKGEHRLKSADAAAQGVRGAELNDRRAHHFTDDVGETDDAEAEKRERQEAREPETHGTEGVGRGCG